MKTNTYASKAAGQISSHYNYFWTSLYLCLISDSLSQMTLNVHYLIVKHRHDNIGKSYIVRCNTHNTDAHILHIYIFIKCTHTHTQSIHTKHVHTANVGLIKTFWISIINPMDIILSTWRCIFIDADSIQIWTAIWGIVVYVSQCYRKRCCGRVASSVFHVQGQLVEGRDGADSINVQLLVNDNSACGTVYWKVRRV